MIIVDNTYETLQGERFTQEITGFDFDALSQLVILLYKATESGYSLAWTKTATDQYPNAGVIEKREEDGKIVFTVDTTGLSTGDYDIEVRGDVGGVLAAIVKDRYKFLTIKPSRT